MQNYHKQGVGHENADARIPAGGDLRLPSRRGSNSTCRACLIPTSNTAGPLNGCQCPGATARPRYPCGAPQDCSRASSWRHPHGQEERLRMDVPADARRPGAKMVKEIAAKEVLALPPAGVSTLRCEIHSIATPGEFQAATAQWLHFLDRATVAADFFTDPLVVAQSVAFDRGDRLLLGHVYREGHLVAIVPLICRNEERPVRLGLYTLFRLSACTARLPDFEFPREQGTDPFDVVVAVVEACSRLKLVDLLSVDSAPADSDGQRHQGFTVDGIQSTYSIEIKGSFDTYFQTSVTKHREVGRRVRRFADKAGASARVTSFRQPAEMGPLHAALTAVWKQSWHARLGQQPVPPLAHLIDLAAKGCVRSYVLFTGEQPVASIIGFQYHGTFHAQACAYDQAWQSSSPGNVLLYYALKDLFEVDSPERLDFGFGYSEYKEVWGTHEHRRGSIRIGITGRGKLVTGLQSMSDKLFRWGKATLAWTGIPRLIKRKIREGK